ncbi:MAG: response regulator [Limisphaerales bacterium]
MALAGQFTILLLEDQEDDAFLLKRAFKQAGIQAPIQVVQDGLEGIAYLQGAGIYSDRNRYPVPRVILLDLKMPRMGGLEFLEWIEKNPHLRVIPTIVLTSSQLASDVKRAYELKASTFMVKPTSPDDMAELARAIEAYWQRALTPLDVG